MSKKPKPKTAVPTVAHAPLKHSPFAGLAGVALPSPPVASAEVASPAESPAPAKAPAAPAPRPASTLAPEAGPARGRRLVLRRETKHRGGKTAIIVTGFGGLDDLRAGEVESLARELKRSLACGGSVEGAAPHCEIVLQGDQPARVAELDDRRATPDGARYDGV